MRPSGIYCEICCIGLTKRKWTQNGYNLTFVLSIQRLVKIFIQFTKKKLKKKKNGTNISSSIG